MNFYLSAVNSLLRHSDVQPSIGLILCKTKNQVIAEYALQHYTKPIGISEDRLAESLPDKLQGRLPTIEELESELGSANRGGSLKFCRPRWTVFDGEPHNDGRQLKGI